VGGPQDREAFGDGGEREQAPDADRDGAQDLVVAQEPQAVGGLGEDVPALLALVHRRAVLDQAEDRNAADGEQGRVDREGRVRIDGREQAAGEVADDLGGLRGAEGDRDGDGEAVAGEDLREGRDAGGVVGRLDGGDGEDDADHDRDRQARDEQERDEHGPQQVAHHHDGPVGVSVHNGPENLREPQVGREAECEGRGGQCLGTRGAPDQCGDRDPVEHRPDVGDPERDQESGGLAVPEDLGEPRLAVGL
jgi:hypothetical protein